MNKHQQRLKEMKKKIREDEKFRKEAAQLSINVLSVVPAYVMLEFGWGNKRLARFIRRYAKVVDDIAKKKVTPETLAEEIYSRAKIKYDEGNWYDAKTRKSVREGL